ncbi:unnamed protein product [Rotaria sp. Silwood1]|nr:unnamed protein product [Rotaria sp. Silwood1]
MPKKPIDINKPRGPITAYALFVRTCRDELRRKYPHLTVDYNVIAKKCSDRWKSMNDNEKKRFNDIVDLQRKRYKEELAVYQQEQLIKQQQELQTSSILHQTSSTQYFIEPIQQHTIVNIQKKSIKKRERKPKDPHAPKKPLSAYFLFCADERPKVLSLQTVRNMFVSNGQLVLSQCKTKRHIYLTFVESCSLSSTNEQPCIEIIRKSNSSLTYLLNECISFEYFDTVKNDFQSFIYAYFESYTISIFFSDDNLDKKSLIIKHIEYMLQSKIDKTSTLNINSSSQDSTQSQSLSTTIQQQSQQQTSVLPCPPTTEHILHTFDINLIPYGSIINRDHILIGPARLYFTTTDLYIASIYCNRQDLKITITNQCPSNDKAILCIPYFTIKNYGNRSNIFLIELGKSNYGNGEIHMKCYSSSLASTIHLLVSPVIEERPLILSSAFQNQLLTNKRIEKSKNIHPPIQLNNDTANQSILDSPLSFIKNKKTIEKTDSNSNTTTTNEIKSHLIVGFFRTLTKNVSNLRRSATFHSNNNNNNNNEQLLTINNNLLSKNKSVAFNIDENKFHNDQHQIILPEYQKKTDSTLSVSSTMTKQTNETILTSTSTINTNKQETTMGTYIDMGLTMQHSNQNQQQEIHDEIITKEPTATAEIGVNTTISLSPHVRSAIIVGNSVHLIVDDHNVFPIGQRSFTSPASVMQPFKTQLSGQTITNGYG